MCKAWEDMKKEVAEETAKRIEAETLHLSADQAMAALKVPESKRTTFSAML